MSESESEYDEEMDLEPSRFQNVDLSSAVQNCRVFNNVPLDSEKCIKAMMDLLYLMYTGRANLSEDEATDIFFMSTKLMQSSNPKLRRLHYVLLKELSPKVEASYIASNSLMVDMKNQSDTIRRNALRTLFSVMDSSLYHSMDRTIVESINSKSPEVVNTALVTGIHLANANVEMAKKWTNQLSQQRYDGGMSTYSRVALLHIIRTNDRLSAQRLLEDAKSGSSLRSPMALALVVSVCGDQLRQIYAKGGSRQESEEFLKFVNSMTHHHSDIVAMQACIAICSLPQLTDGEVSSCVMALSNRLKSYNSVFRFSAVSLLSKLSQTHPEAVGIVTNSIENLVNDGHRGVSTCAIIILLRTGSESSIKRLLTQLSLPGSLKGLDDDLKFTMINATLELHQKFPGALEPITNFLFVALSEVESAFVKQRVVDTMIHLSKTDPSSKETILTKLADCIDDCDFPAMTKRVLAHLSEEVPQCSNPRRYIRYIYNHCKLEQADIRAVAVRTLAKIAAKLPSLRSFIVPLILRCCTDEDDEVRDRAIFYTKLFQTKNDRLLELHITEVADQVASQRHAATAVIAEKNSLLRKPNADGQQVPATQNGVRSAVGGPGSKAATTGSGSSGPAMSSVVLDGRDAMAKVAPLRQLGTPARSCNPVPLTEEDNEYAVSLIKHITSTHIVLQFRIHNTMDSARFAQVTVTCETDEVEVEPKFAIPVDLIPPGAVGYAYVVLEYEEGVFPSGEVPCSISFAIQEEGEEEEPIDASNLEEFSMESFEIDLSDFFRPLLLEQKFEEKWEEAEQEGETAGTYELQSMRNLTMAVNEIASFYGLSVVGGVPEKVTAASYTLCMSGVAVNAAMSAILIKAKVFISTSNAVVLQLAIRGGDEDLRQYLTDALLA